MDTSESSSEIQETQETEKIIVFCLTGDTFSATFLMCWTNLIAEVSARGYKVLLIPKGTKARCLGLEDVVRDEAQLPFDNKINYTAIFFIHASAIFKPDHVFQLLDSPHNVTTAFYLNKSMDKTDIVKREKYMSIEDFERHRGMLKVKVSYTDITHSSLNFVCIKKGIFEQFRDSEQNKVTNPFSHPSATTPDIAFCLNCRDRNIRIHVDLNTRIGNEIVIPV